MAVLVGDAPGRLKAPHGIRKQIIVTLSDGSRLIYDDEEKELLFTDPFGIDYKIRFSETGDGMTITRYVDGIPDPLGVIDRSGLGRHEMQLL